MAIWILVYLVGAMVTMVIQSKVNPNQYIVQDKDQMREYDMGVVVSIVAWPVILPIMAIMWFGTYIEDASYRRRKEEWQKKSGRV